MSSMGVGRARSLLILPALLLLIIFTAHLRYSGLKTAQFLPVESEISNPLTGLAVSARSDPADAPEGVRLAWVKASWRELEPEEGRYAFDAFDEAIHLSKWREKGVKLVFRLALDLSDSGFACDLPLWLREKTGGTAYALDGRQHFAPDYSDPILQEAHLQLLQAIKERYGADVAYVEMGSLGQDGAWQSPEGAPPMPMTDVTSVYIWQYFTVFQEQPVLAAAPYHEAMLSGGGAYLPALGDSEKTWSWINLHRFGGWDAETGVLLRANEGYGLSAPAGAWIDPSALTALEENPEALKRMAEEARASYICIDSAQPLSAKGQETLRELIQNTGYRLWIRQAQWMERIRRDYSLYVDLTMANGGSAPTPLSWPVRLALLDESGAPVHAETVEADPRAWLPGDTALRIRLTVPSDLPKGEYKLAFAVCEPDTFEPAVRFAMNCETAGLWHILGPVEVY